MHPRTPPAVRLEGLAPALLALLLATVATTSGCARAAADRHGAASGGNGASAGASAQAGTTSGAAGGLGNGGLGNGGSASSDPPPGRQPDPTPVASPIDASCSTALSGPFDATLPVPHAIVVHADDHTATLQWNGDLTWLREDDDANGSVDNPDVVEGYRICWGATQDQLQHGALVNDRIGELFGVPNGEQQVAVIQSVDKFGHVSKPSEVVTFTGDASRVEGLRSEMTGFFDDFNLSEGPVNELDWNVAFSNCNDPTASHTYVTQQHAVSVIGNHTFLPGSVAGCDRNQNIARVRHIFDFTGREGRIVFDFDGADGNRSTWYVDVFPYASASDSIDITGHATFDPGNGHPGRFLRFSQAGNLLMIHQHDAAGNPIAVEKADFSWQHMNQRLVQGTMRHFELRVSKNHAAIYIDGQLVLENAGLNLDFEKGIVHWAQFAYNPIKVGKPWVRLNWDNFGFDGPRATESVIHNYKRSFDRDDALQVESWDGSSPASVTLNIPDSIAGATSARLFFTIQSHAYSWSASDSVALGGQTFPIPEPTSSAGTWQNGMLGSDYTPFSMSMDIPISALATGDNTLSISAQNTRLLNQHIELGFDRASAPAYTQPADYLAAHPLPDLEPFGPSFVFRRVAGQDISSGGDNPYYIYLGNPTVSGSIDVEVAANGTRQIYAFGRLLGISKLELLVDDQVTASIDTAASVATPEIDSMTFHLDTTKLTNGDHQLRVLAYDSAGSVGRPGYESGPGLNGGDPSEKAALPITVSN